MSAPNLLVPDAPPPPRDREGWPIRPGARVRVQPRPLPGCSTARHPYSATVVGIGADERGPIVEVRDERGRGLHFARPEQVRVVRKRVARAGR